MAASKKVPVRRCVGCGEVKPKKELIRVVRTAEGGILLDYTGRKNGRGAYLCMNSGCLARAEKSRGLARSLKAEVSREIYEALKREMEKIENG